MAKWLEHQLVFITQLRFIFTIIVFCFNSLILSLTKMKIKNKVHIIVIKIQFQKKVRTVSKLFLILISYTRNKRTYDKFTLPKSWKWSLAFYGLVGKIDFEIWFCKIPPYITTESIKNTRILNIKQRKHFY